MKKWFVLAVTLGLLSGATAQVQAQAQTQVQTQARMKSRAQAQTQSHAQAQEAGKEDCCFHTALELYPTFMGGDFMVFRNWVHRNIRYPREAFDRGEEGRVVISFVIDTLGRVTQVEPLKMVMPTENNPKEPELEKELPKRGSAARRSPVLKRSYSPALIREAVRVIRSSPDWTPGRMGHDSLKVRMKYHIPVDFMLWPDPLYRWPAVVPPAEWRPSYTFCPGLR